MTTPFMVFNVMYTICEGPKLDAYRSQSVMRANCQHDSIHRHKEFLLLKNCNIVDHTQAKILVNSIFQWAHLPIILNLIHYHCTIYNIQCHLSFRITQCSMCLFYISFNYQQRFDGLFEHCRTLASLLGKKTHQ